MEKEYFMYLQNAESVVATMSATIFAALIQNQPLTEANEDELVEKALNIAIKLAERTEKLVKSDQEWVKKDSAHPFL